MTTDKKKTDAPAPAWKRLFAKGEKGEPEKGEPKIRIRKETTERYQPPKWGLWMLQGFVLVFFCTSPLEAIKSAATFLQSASSDFAYAWASSSTLG